jgi:hypothetical protein
MTRLPSYHEIKMPVAWGEPTVRSLTTSEFLDAFGAGLFPYVEPEYRSWIDKKQTMCPVRRARGTIKQATAKVVTRQRRPTLTSVARQASKAGIAVARYEVKPDGTIVVVTGESSAVDINPWDEVLTNAADQKRPS